MRCAVSLVVLVCGAGVVMAGDLNPPVGPVAPTMKTLDEVEPRTAINQENTPGDADSTFRITEPGSYYLTGNVQGEDFKHGIEIESDHVTIDLMGFTMTGDVRSRRGISTANVQTRITVRNGIVTGWPENGVSLIANECLVEGVISSSNGGSGMGAEDGIVVANNSIVRNCVAVNNATDGIQVVGSGIVENCTVELNGTDGIKIGSGIVRDCIAKASGRFGIATDGDSVISGCLVDQNGTIGINASGETTVSGCTVTENGTNGIRVTLDCVVLNNLCHDNAEAGIIASSSDNRIEGNTCNDNQTGILVSQSGNLIVRNAVSGGTQYDIVPGNDVGSIVTSPVGAGAWDNFEF